MKVQNWCRKLSAALVAGGLMMPAAATAADLNTNLVANPGFEQVDSNVTCCFGAVRVNDWDDGSQRGFAYNYSQNYDNGGPLAGGGTYYFTANGDGGGDNVTMPGQVTQLIDFSTGPTAAAIAGGTARYELSAFFSSYLNDGDFGNVQLDFINPILFLPPVVISDNDTSTWTQVSTSGLIPIGTTGAQISVFGTPISAGPDGYIDNVSFSIVPEPSTVALAGMGLATAGFGLLRRREQA